MQTRPYTGRYPINGLVVAEDGKLWHNGRSVWTYKNKRVYRCCTLNRVKYFVHLLVADTWCPNALPITYPLVDHIDGDRMNSHRSNLRWSNHNLNSHNRKGVKGYYPRNGRYCATIKCHGRKLALGTFDTPALARAAYLEASARMFEVC